MFLLLGQNQQRNQKRVRIMTEVTLKDVIKRLDLLIALLKSINDEKIQAIKQQILRDPVSRKILELADGTKEYNFLAEEVANATGRSIRTVKAKFSQLSDKGAIQGIRKGRKVCYQNTGLYV